MKRLLFTLLSVLSFTCVLRAADLKDIPMHWRWLSNEELAFSNDGSYADSSAFTLSVPFWHINPGRKAPLSKPDVMPTKGIDDAIGVNMTYSPDSLMIAFTKDNDLWVMEVASGRQTRLTADGSDLILNGYASWVYYEEIFGRPSKYKAFWWSPDSKKIGFYRFDNTQVPMFPIYSPFGQHGELKQTRYPKAGDPNPSVKIGIVDLSSHDFKSGEGFRTVWADFDSTQDQYFGIPFWDAEGRRFFVSREPRVQQTLELYAVCAADGKATKIYEEHSDTWLDWIENAVFTPDGMYMARNVMTGWDQAYYLPYDGSPIVKKTHGQNWSMVIERVDEKKGLLYFTAKRDSDVRNTLYQVDKKGRISALTDLRMDVSNVSFSPNGAFVAVSLSNLSTPTQIWVISTSKPSSVKFKVADAATDDFDATSIPIPHIEYITTGSGFRVPAAMTLPKDFDPSKRFPVVMEIYGGPGTQYVKDRWRKPSAMGRWFYENGFIRITADASVSGHNGKAGMDLAYEDLHAAAMADFVDWAHWLQSLPYVDAKRIGVEGFSFGGANTAKLVMEHSDCFRCGIAGGGVYDWMLYDSHYTERFMNTPENNPDGYKRCRVMDCAPNMTDGVLKLTHGTGDDNVHFQHTLQLVDALQRNGKIFELMIYPDGMHGYRGEQGRHSDASDQQFWLRNLKTFQ